VFCVTWRLSMPGTRRALDQSPSCVRRLEDAAGDETHEAREEQ